jgi:hypothetical protein
MAVSFVLIQKSPKDQVSREASFALGAFARQIKQNHKAAIFLPRYARPGLRSAKS